MKKILSIFDGISAAQVALKNLNIECEYYASEVDKYAIQITQKNFPNTVQLGSVSDIQFSHCDEAQCRYINNIPFAEYGDGFDLLSFGFPCQDLSIAKKDRKGLDGERSGLFYEALRILKEVKPKYFLAENVNSMSKEMKDIISKELFDIQPIMINSSLLTAQNRKRLFWLGKLQENGTYAKVDIPKPEDKGILLKDILESGLPYQEKAHSLTASYNGAVFWNSIEKKQRSMIAEPHRIGQIGKGGQGDRIYSAQGKSVCLSANGGGRGAKTGLYKIDLPDGEYSIRKLTPNECARLQGFPDNYHDGISNTQAYKCYGNSFTVPVIEHILKHLEL